MMPPPASLNLGSRNLSDPAGDPPWEWVEGDAVQAARFAFIRGIVVGTASLLLTVVALSRLGSAGAVGFTPAPVFLVSPFVALALAGASMLLVYYPQRFPVVGRIGISPKGLRLVLPLRNLTAEWQHVEFGQNWVRVSPPWGCLKFRLTDRQIARIARFLHPH